MGLSVSEFVLSYVDEFIDKLLTEDKSCSIVLPRLTKRIALEDLNQLQPKVIICIVLIIILGPPMALASIMDQFVNKLQVIMMSCLRNGL